MSLVGQALGIGVLFVVVYLLHRRARKADFERFRAHHSKRKYRVPVSELATAGDEPDDAPDAR